MTRPWWLKKLLAHQPTLVTLGKGLCAPNDLRDLSISFPRNGTIFWRAAAWTKKPYAPVSALDLRCPPTKPWNRDVIQIETSLDSSIKIFKVLCFFFRQKSENHGFSRFSSGKNPDNHGFSQWDVSGVFMGYLSNDPERSGWLHCGRRRHLANWYINGRYNS